jgi:7,8-dihydroneopterin aldolase/epimerase/oxygenase
MAALGLALRAERAASTLFLTNFYGDVPGGRLPSARASGMLPFMTATGWMLADALGMERRPQRKSVYRVFVRDLVLPFRIGVHAYEHNAPQRVRVNAELLVETVLGDDEFRCVLNYETIVGGIRRLAEGEHINLVETLAQRILDLCLADPRVPAARVVVEKLDIYPDAESVGVAMKRRR